MKTGWSIFRDYINSRELGSYVTKQEILDLIRGDQDNKRLANFTSNVLQVYLKMSCVYFLKRCYNDRNKYKILILKFPKNFTITQLRSIYKHATKV